jgi:hypothetical protein
MFSGLGYDILCACDSDCVGLKKCIICIAIRAAPFWNGAAEQREAQ